MSMDIKITATNQQDAGDVKLAKTLEEIVKYQAEDLEGVMAAIVSAHDYFYLAFGENHITKNRNVWNRIMEEVIKLKIELLKKSN